MLTGMTYAETENNRDLDMFDRMAHGSFKSSERCKITPHTLTKSTPLNKAANHNLRGTQFITTPFVVDNKDQQSEKHKNSEMNAT